MERNTGESSSDVIRFLRCWHILLLHNVFFNTSGKIHNTRLGVYFITLICVSIFQLQYISLAIFNNCCSNVNPHFSNIYIYIGLYIVKVYSFIIFLIYIKQNETRILNLALSNVEMHMIVYLNITL